MMYKTRGINHLGLSVKDLDQSVAFFVDCLGGRIGQRRQLSAFCGQRRHCAPYPLGSGSWARG